MAVATFTKSGTKATTAAKLDNSVFGVEITSHELLKSAYVAYLANGRTSAGKTKTRGLVRGGGRKPWKQKGTGRARFGSSRNPIWRGGGIVFGPTGEENYSHNMHQKAKQQAVRQALTLAAKDSLIIVESIDSKDGKVAPIVAFLNKVGAKGNTLIVNDAKDDLLMRATANLQNVKIVSATYLTVYDLLNADSVVMTTKALSAVHEWLKPSTKAANSKQLTADSQKKEAK